MSGADEILNAIDHALLDYQVSGDAMRWTPTDKIVIDETVVEVTTVDGVEYVAPLGTMAPVPGEPLSVEWVRRDLYSGPTPPPDTGRSFRDIVDEMLAEVMERLPQVDGPVQAYLDRNRSVSDHVHVQMDRIRRRRPEPPPPPREPRMHDEIPGCTRHLFVGGPVSGDVIPIPDDSPNSPWAVVAHRRLNDVPFGEYLDPVYYTPYTYINDFLQVVFTVYQAGNPTEDDVRAALAYWVDRGWTPEGTRPAQP